MSTTTQIEQLEKWVAEILEPETTYFLVSLRVKPTNNIKLFIDGDTGVAIDKCVQINRKLYKLIEEAALYPDGDFSLEVSSPGIEEPLLLHRQYVKNIGRFVEITFADDTKKEGKLLEVSEADIKIEHTEGKGKKMITEQLVIPFTNIKTTTVLVKF